MNQYVTGAMIKRLREDRKITQKQLAEKICVSDKAISKWENGRGYPDITLLEPLSEVFGVSIAELLSGNEISNMNISANVMRSKFYVCPVCANVIHSMGEAVINCHGIQLTPCDADSPNENHKIYIETVEDEYFVRIEHEMTKRHYISFIAAMSQNKVQIVKLYPEGNAEARFKIDGVQKIFFYCNKDGLFYIEK